MGRLGLALGGALIGSFTPLGPGLGFALGSLVGSIAFPEPDQIVEGPRIGDNYAASSTYGTPIPLGYGTNRVPGQMIWASGIREVESRREISGGKGGLGGGGDQVQVTYTPYADFAMLFQATEVQDVTRIWGNSKLIYDKRNEATTLDDVKTLFDREGALAFVSILNGEVRKYRLKFRLYRGTETQLPDSLIEADKGAGRVPAHRGYVMIVFDNMDLTDFRSYPNITAELAAKTISTNSVEVGTEISLSTYQTNVCAPDYVRRRVYVIATSGGNNHLRVYNMDTLNEIRQVFEPFGSGTLWGSDSGFKVGRFTGWIYADVSTPSNQIIRLDPDTLTEGRSYGAGSPFIGEFLEECSAILPEGKVRHFLVVSNRNQANIRVVDADQMIDISTIDVIPFGGSPEDPIGIVASHEQTFEDAKCYVATQPTSGDDPIKIYKLTINPRSVKLLGLGSPGAQLDRIGTIDPSAWNNDASGTKAQGPGLDENDNGLIFTIQLNGSAYQVMKWSEVEGLVWSTKITDDAYGGDENWLRNSRIQGGKLGIPSLNDTMTILDLNDGKILVDDYDWSSLNNDVTLAPGGTGFWDDASDQFYALNRGSEGRVARLNIDRAKGTGFDVGDVITDISQRVGLSASDIDVTGVSDSGYGYLVSRQSSARKAIEPLTTAFFIDGFESDHKVRFVKRGQAPALTIQESELVRASGEEQDLFKPSRTQEVELPERVTVIYVDQDHDHQVGSQSYKRMRTPFRSQNSRAQRKLEIPIGITASQAIQIAEKSLFTAWNERTSYPFRLPPQYVALDPADVITIQLANGVSVDVRLTNTEIGADNSIKCEGVNENAVTLISDSVSQGALGIPAKIPPTEGDAKLFQVNVPLLRDVDDLGRTGSRLYFGMTTYAGFFGGGTLFRSLDAGTSYSSVAIATLPIAWGTISNKLPTTSVPFQTDTTTVLKVYMQGGTLASVTQSQFLNDANIALVGSPTTNKWEVIAFRDAVEGEDNVYDVSTIIRGKRGTDVFVNDHSDNEFFLLLTPTTVFSHVLTLGQINSSALYKPVTFNQILENVNPASFTGLGYDLKPWAPVLLTAVVDGGDNIDLAWTRRTRIGGQLKNFTGLIPLSEDAEVYEVDIKDGPGGSVVRTLGSGGTLTDPTVQYDNADILTDFGMVPASLSFEVFQISAQVGRGFGREATITF